MGKITRQELSPQLNYEIGILSSLNTTNKNSLVGAINEIDQNVNEATVNLETVTENLLLGISQAATKTELHSLEESVASHKTDNAKIQRRNLMGVLNSG